MTGGLRESALRRPHDRLGAYGECRDSEQPLAANLSAWIIVRATGEIIMNNYGKAVIKITTILIISDALHRGTLFIPN